MGASARPARLARLARLAVALAVAAGSGAGPALRPATAHPLGNFSISHYASLRVDADAVRLRYVLDLAEIPTFQEVQASGLTPEAGHPSVTPYLARSVEAFKDGLVVTLDGRRLPLQAEASEAIFPPGAGGLPTLKVGVTYRAPLDPAATGGELAYRDGNYPGRAGWKEVVAVAGPGVALRRSSAPTEDRSRQLSDYPTDLLASPPQDLEAVIVFARLASPPVSAAGVPRAAGSAAPPPPAGSATDAGPRRPDDGRAPSRAATDPAAPPASARPPATPAALLAPAPATRGFARAPASPEPAPEGPSSPAHPEGDATAARLEVNRQGTPRDRFTKLITAPAAGWGMVGVALAVAASLGALHALEPGHGKTVVAAYLVGSRGTAWHAVLLGLIVTASHTAGVYLLGAVTLYASRYVVPERIYPWLGALSGLVIAGLGVTLFLRRYAGRATAGHHHPGGDHGHHHDPVDDHGDHHGHGQRHGHDDLRAHAHHAHEEPAGGHAHGHSHVPAGEVTWRSLLALGVTGGIVPCPAALVVLLSALALRRVGFGLLLIVAFSAGLAAVLIGIGFLMVYARRFMVGFRSEGRVVTRWLPLASAAVIAVTGAAIAVQALVAAGIVVLRL